MQTLRTLSWIACGIYATIPAYWMMVHPFAERWRTARYKLTVLGPLWIATWCIAWALPIGGATLCFTTMLEPGSPRRFSVVISVFMYVHAARELSFMRAIGQHELEPERHPKMLITFGVHRMVRHPMYLGHLCTMLGFALGAGTVACFALFAFASDSGNHHGWLRGARVARPLRSWPGRSIASTRLPSSRSRRARRTLIPRKIPRCGLLL